MNDLNMASVFSAVRLLVSILAGAVVGWASHKGYVDREQAPAAITAVGVVVWFVLSMAWSRWTHKTLLNATPPDRIAPVLACMMLPVIALYGGGCAENPGNKLNAPDGVNIWQDTSSNQGATFLGYDRDTIVTGPLVHETSKINSEGMQETNGGGTHKQRLAVVLPMLVNGSVERMMIQNSAGANFVIRGVDAQFAEGGVLKSVHIDQLDTDNAAVQNSINQGVIAEVQAAINGTNASRDVQIERLKTQAKGIDAAADIAKAALPLIQAAFGKPPVP